MTKLSFPSRRYERLRERPLILLACAFFLLSATYSIINPIHEGTDELRHYRFVRSIVENKRLPVQGQEACRSQSHHPPLIYVLGALATGWIDTGRGVCDNPTENPFWGYNYWEVGTDNKNLYIHTPAEAFPWQGEALAARIVRFINVAIGTLTVMLTYLTARLIWPRQPAYAIGATSLIAFNPMFLYMAGTINNDVIAALSGGLVTFLCVSLLRQSEELSVGWGLALGSAYGLALMSKFNLAPVVALIALVFIYKAWPGRQWKTWLQANLALAGSSALIAGWWFVRNWLIFGDPTGFREVTELWGVRNPADSVGLALQELPYAWSSLWGRFGYGQIPLPQWVYGLLWAGALLAFIGLIVGFVRRWRETERLPFNPFLIFLGLMALLFFAVLFAYMLVSPAGPMGRFLFPGVPAFVILLFAGLSGWLRREWQINWLSGLLTSLMLLFALWALLGYLAPAYAAPDAWAEGEQLPNATNVRFEPLVALRGYEIDRPQVGPGEALSVDLYWEVLAQPPGDYYLFVHLVDEIGTIVAQRDTHPGSGRFPASQWRPGDRFVDQIRLDVPPTAYPAGGEIVVGLYAPDAYRLPVVNQFEVAVGDSYALGGVQISGEAGELGNREAHNYEERVWLRGYRYSSREIGLGEPLRLELEWELGPGQTAADLDGIELLLRARRQGSGHELFVQRPLLELFENGDPNQRTRTLVWEIFLPDDAPPGAFDFSLILFDVFTQERLNRIAEDGHWINNELQLAPVRVVEGDG